MTDKERDDALIAEKKRLAEQLQIFAYGLGSSPSASMMLQAAAILRGDEQPKPDRAEVLASIVLDLARTDFNSDDLDEREPEAVAIIRRHFDELRAEWEAERPAVVVPEDVRRVVWETARDALSKNWLPVYDFIKSLDGAKGGE